MGNTNTNWNLKKIDEPYEGAEVLMKRYFMVKKGEPEMGLFIGDYPQSNSSENFMWKRIRAGAFDKARKELDCEFEMKFFEVVYTPKIL